GGELDVYRWVAGRLPQTPHICAERACDALLELTCGCSLCRRILQITHGAGEIWAVVRERIDAKPGSAHDHQVVSAIGERVDIAELRQRTDRIRQRRAAHLDALANRQYTERGVLIDAVA